MNDKSLNQVMIDLETLGTTADAVVVSIGAVKFDLLSNKIGDDGFYASVSIESNQDAGRRIDEDTLLWWFKQPAAALQVFTEDKMALTPALEELSDWLGNDNYTVWANGPSFDIAMLEFAYKKAKMTVPWAFWNSRCVRTYRDLPGARNVPKFEEGVKHNALSDALSQAKHIQAIHHKLFMAPSTSTAKPKA